ncbi:protein IAL1-like [Phragmites australis]|uniref:protein IAL1-like n=1 Tax=Phragmites australis TaxID=29695 RepID=UPI002D7A2310|nr:protein IAL1-like [Phragmites australis]
MAMEAYRRVQDPVHGCAGIISRLQGEIQVVQSELARTQAQIAVHTAAAAHSQPAALGSQLNTQARAPLQQQRRRRQQGDALMVQEPFHGLDALLDDHRVDVNLFDEEMST